MPLIRGKLGKDAKALASGMLDEIPQEVLDEGISQLTSALVEIRDVTQALADFYTGLPRLITTSGILGAGGQHVAQSAQNHAQTSQPTSQPAIPLPTTPTPRRAHTANSRPFPPAPASNSKPPPATAKKRCQALCEVIPRRHFMFKIMTQHQSSGQRRGF